MDDFKFLDLKLININNIPSSETFDHDLAGIMTEAMKRIPNKSTLKNSIQIRQRIDELNSKNPLPYGFTTSTIEYMINVKSIDNLDELMKQSQQLSQSTRGEIMTLAENLRAEGISKGADLKTIEIAIKLLEQGVDKKIICASTNLELSKIEALSKKLKH